MAASSASPAKPERASYTPLDFTTWRETDSLVIAPKFQRRGVWGRPAKAYLIDTMIRGLPIPPLYLRVTQSSDKKRTIREVIDGQQRISAVLSYLDGDFALTPSLDARYAGKEFNELDPSDQDAIRNYSFISEVFSSISDAAILEIFARMNTYSVPLTQQELRNGRYFGYFKQSAYALAREHVEFWRQNRIMTEQSIARMAEAELASELMIMQLDGLQDKKKSINTFYSNYIDVITRTFGDSLAASHFRRVPLFYTLFGVVYHRRYGVPKVELASPRKALSEAERKALRGAAAKLSDALQLARDDEPVPARYQKFVNASTTQTDNIQPRRTRLETLYRSAF
jgi:hypothetical protein